MSEQQDSDGLVVEAAYYANILRGLASAQRAQGQIEKAELLAHSAKCMDAQQTTIDAMSRQLVEMRGLMDEAFDLLGGVDGASELRGRMLKALEGSADAK